MIRHKNGISRGQIAIDKFVCACQRGTDATLCQLLSSGDVHPDATSEEGKTALTLAILQRADNAVRILLQHGADVNKTSHVYYQRDHLSPNMCSYDESPLNTAARLDYSSISKLLIESGAHVNVQSECRLPQGVQTVKDRTALHFSADQGNVEVASYLVKHGAVVNITDKQQETPLHLAVRCRGSIKCGGQREVVSLLLQHGSLPNAANRSSQVPLYLAAFYGCAGKASVLISSGADVNFSCSRDNSLYGYVTALHVAAAKNRVHLAKLLVGHGACMNITNALDYTPLQVNLQTQSKSRVADLLILHGASLSVIDYNGFTLMATLIHNMRLDCELLARLLVCAGYSLNRDLWIQPEHLRENWSTSSKADADRDADVESSEEDSPVVRVPNIHIPHGRVEKLCSWLRDRQTSPACLTDICRTKIRRYLSDDVTHGSSIVPAIQQLPLPRSVINYLLLKDVCELSEI